MGPRGRKSLVHSYSEYKGKPKPEPGWWIPEFALYHCAGSGQISIFMKDWKQASNVGNVGSTWSTQFM